MKKPVVVILFLLFFVGCSEKERQASKQPGRRSINALTVETVQPADVEDFLEAVGTVHSRKTAVLSSKSVGIITSIAVREGDKVTRGQTLVEIDNRDVRADLSGAEAAAEETEWALKGAESAIAAANGRRDFAAATFRRYESLLPRGSVTPQEYDEANSKYKVANAEVNQAEENLRALKAKQAQARAKVAYSQTLLSYTRVTAPFEGVVTSKTAEVGALASPGSPLLTVEELGRYRLEAEVGESSVAFVRVGNIVPVRINSLAKELSGTIAEIVPVADPQTRTFTVKIELPPDPNIRSGLYAKTYIHSISKKALLVPETAIIQRGQLVGVYVVDKSGLARLRLVTAGKRYDKRLEILSGLSPAERIIVKGAESVTDGMRVTVLQESR
jgi:multidrug efflux pump subunit AcrA (membrane-fusion protein)